VPAEIDRGGVILPDSFWRDDMTEQTIAQTAPTFWQKTIGSDWWPVVAFSVAGLLLMLDLMLRFPDWGAIIAQANQF
jgi:hypothetical protein